MKKSNLTASGRRLRSMSSASKGQEASSSYRSTAGSDRSANSSASGDDGKYSLPPFPGKTTFKLTETQKERRRVEVSFELSTGQV